MSYEGIKFDVVLENKTLPNHENIEELKKWCKEFHEKGLTPPYEGGSYGNLSFRTNKRKFVPSYKK